METIMQINEVINNFVWGPPGLTLLVGTGVYLTFLLRFPQLRYFFPALIEVFSFREKSEEDNSISSFAAMTTAMAATVGTGNVAGVATALHLGGPGALVWMLISAFFGISAKFAEITLAMHFRQKDAHGDWRGGPMYILEYGLAEWGGVWKRIGKLLAVLFALLVTVGSLGIGAAVQANSATEMLFMGWDVDSLSSGLIMAVAVGLVIVGGLVRLSRVTVIVVPFMIIFYLVSVSVILVGHAGQIPGAVAEAFRMAFSPDTSAIAGGVAGWGVMEAVQRGIARGVFSNEAGMGSAPMAYATAESLHPVQTGFYGIFEVFLDTFVICTFTGLAILVTGAVSYYPDLTGGQLALQSFELALGSAGKYILSIGLMLFAITTILGWYWYAETSSTYLFGVRFKPVMKLLFIVMIIIGASGAQLFDVAGNEYLNNLWSISDTLNGLMAFPNLIGLLLLSLLLRKLVKDYDAQEATAAPEKRPPSKELRNLLVVSVCASLIPIAIISLWGGSRSIGPEKTVPLQTALASGRLVFGFDEEFPPMSFTGEHGEVVGVDIDMAREVCSRLGVEFVAQPISWENKENELDSRNIDCICSMSVTSQSQNDMSLSEAYVMDNMVFIIRGDSSIRWRRDFKERVIGVQAGSTTYDALETADIRRDVTVVPLEDNMTVLQQLKEGKLDVGLVDSVAAYYFISSSSERYFILADSVGQEGLALGFRKEDKELRDRVQKILSEMRADGTLGKISKKWFGSDIMIVK